MIGQNFFSFIGILLLLARLGTVVSLARQCPPSPKNARRSGGGYGGETKLTSSNSKGSENAIKEGQRIEKLLVRALKVAEGISSGSPSTPASNRTGLMKMSFKVRHTEKIELEDSFLARDYLSLPASNYSVLSSNLVTRKVDPITDSGDVFEFSVPIPTRTRRLDGTQEAVIKAFADVRVTPCPDEGEVVMESGPIYLQTSTHNTTSAISMANDNESISKGEESADDEIALRSILPHWLISSPISSDEESHASANALKSSIQAGFRVKLMWKPVKGAASSLPFDISTNQEVEFDSLPITAQVNVFVDLGLPLRNDISRAVNFPPVNLLLSQAGNLIVKAVIRGVAPTLSGLLVKDYEQYREGTRELL